MISLKGLRRGYLASGSMDKSIKIWNVNDGRLVKNIQEQTDGILDFELLENGYLASASDEKVKIWNLDGLLSKKFIK